MLSMKIAAFAVVGGLLLAGCQQENRRLVRETGWGTGMWGVHEEMMGENTSAMKAAVVVLEDDDALVSNKVQAANELGDIGVSTDYVISALGEAMEDDQVMDVRLASARALEKIGSSNAIHELHEAEDLGYVPVGRDYSVLDQYGTPAAPPPTAREVRVEEQELKTERPAD